LPLNSKKYKNLHLRAIISIVLFVYSYSSFSQNYFSKYLELPAKQRLDSLELNTLKLAAEIDSLSFFKELLVINQFASKNKDDLMALHTDYMKALYCLEGKKEAKKRAENQFENLKRKLEKFKKTELGDLLIANVDHYLGILILSNGRISGETLRHFLSADLIYRKIGYKNIQFGGYKLNMIGQYYQLIANDYETALKYYKEAEKYIKNDPIDLHRIFFYRSMAKTLSYFKKYKEAIAYNQKGIAQVRLKKDSVRIGSLLGNIGEIILNHSKDPLNAESFFLEEYKYRSKYNPENYDDIAKVYGNLCHIAALKNDKKAVDSLFKLAFKTLENETDTLGKISALRSIYKNRIIVDTLLGDFKSAFKYQQLFNKNEEFLFRQEIKKAVINAEAQFDTERFKMEAEIAIQEKKAIEYWIAIISLFLILIIIGAYIIYLKNDISRNELSNKLNLEIKEAERRAELDQLKSNVFTNISHELRTPLTLLVAPLDDLEKRFGSIHSITLMKSNLNKLMNLINQILDLSKFDAGRMKLFNQYENLTIFVESVVDSFKLLALSKNIKINLITPKPTITFAFDKDKLEKVLNNLLTNAIKFTPKNGIIKVELIKKEENVVIKVRDSGIGIKEEDLSRIFDRYYQIENKYNHANAGTGVGLALTKELVNIMNGTIKVESKFDEGSEFTVELPFLLPNTEKIDETLIPNKLIDENPSVNIQSDDKSKELLLIVEDNEDMRAYIRDVFSNKFEVMFAKDGRLGAEMALNEIPDLIISDLMMPEMDGLSLCKILKNDLRSCHIPIVLLTAKSDLDCRIEGYETGADEYITKPFSTNELKSRVNNLLKNRKKVYEKFGITEIFENKKNDLNLVFLKNLKTELEKNYINNNLDIDTLSESLNLSSVQLRRKLKALTGYNPVEYIRNFKLEKAQKLLAIGHLSVSEVAFQVGFESLSYFSKVFQDKYGKLPSEWQNKGQ
jgi:signal transduction histidine kinase/DNA-binding response OmpR family regulator